MADTPPKTFTIDDEPKRGRGRPATGAAAPKVTVTATTQDVKKAMATLDSGYNLVATGLMLFGLERSAAEWADSAEQLKLTNEDALKASPKLAKAIASAGSTGGSATFLVTHGMALFGLFTTLRSELADKRADKIIETTPVEDFPPPFFPGQ
jgi:hypothetical protein